ncbi:hypothetical protein [Nocardia amamiensis]|nr:hypothetical protein [Nocardia amamiensis]
MRTGTAPARSVGDRWPGVSRLLDAAAVRPALLPVLLRLTGHNA